MKTLFNQGARDTPTECQRLKILHSEEQRVSYLNCSSNSKLGLYTAQIAWSYQRFVVARWIYDFMKVAQILNPYS